MMRDWTEDLSPEERKNWEKIVDYSRKETFRNMDASAFVLSLVPEGPPDIKFCVELGMAIMLGKPVVAVVQRGVKIPGRLAEIADAVITVTDLDTGEGCEELSAAIGRVLGKIKD